MTGPFADRLFRIAFALAGCYNLAFGLWAAVWPLAFFRLFDLPFSRYSGIWACLGMVVGVYGFLYWHAAWKLEAAWPIIAVGLLGKVLGPIGMVASFGDDWPRRLGMICVFNDLIWWLPFGLFLIRGTAIGRRLASWAPWISVAMHAAALAMMALFLRHASALVNDPAMRAHYVGDHRSLWTIGWALWMASAASYVGFCAWWGSRLGGGTTVAVAAVVIAALGMVCDFAGEGSLILLLVEHLPKSAADWDAAALINTERAFTLISAGAANGLYTLAGILLTLLTPDLPRWVRAAMWITWIAGIGMTVAAVANHTAGMVVSTAALFPPFLVWVAWMGAKWPAVSPVERKYR
jgi:hypothetical protein